MATWINFEYGTECEHAQRFGEEWKNGFQCVGYR